jgi:hypothetical protein
MSRVENFDQKIQIWRKERMKRRYPIDLGKLKEKRGSEELEGPAEAVAMMGQAQWGNGIEFENT